MLSALSVQPLTKVTVTAPLPKPFVAKPEKTKMLVPAIRLTVPAWTLVSPCVSDTRLAVMSAVAMLLLPEAVNSI